MLPPTAMGTIKNAATISTMMTMVIFIGRPSVNVVMVAVICITISNGLCHYGVVWKLVVLVVVVLGGGGGMGAVVLSVVVVVVLGGGEPPHPASRVMPPSREAAASI